jgi:hypothetical protein
MKDAEIEAEIEDFFEGFNQPHTVAGGERWFDS